MFNRKNIILQAITALTLAVILFAGCARFYEVTDPQSGKIFYTRDVDYKKGGAVGFKDAKTGSKIVLQSSDVKKLKSAEYNARVYSK